MKKLIYLAIIFVAAGMAQSCSATKQATLAHEYQQQRPTRTMRTEEPCIALAQEESENLRAYGTATSYVEKTALNEAQRDARNNLAQMIKVAVEGAALDYEKNSQQDLKSTAETLGEEVMKQFVSEEISNTKTIKTSIYDLADGSIQVYVCIEMRTPKEEFNKGVSSTLDSQELIGIQHDRDRFIEKMSEELEQYKQKNQK